MSKIALISAALKSRSAYDGIVGLLSEKEFDEQTATILKEVGIYYDKDPEVSSTDVTIISNTLERNYPLVKTSLLQAVEIASQTEVSEPNLIEDIREQKILAKSQTLMALLGTSASVQDVRAEWEQLDSLFEGRLDTRDLSVHSSELYSYEQFTELAQTVKDNSRIKFVPDILNDKLGGGVGRKSHVVVYARPDAGKTTFVINQVIAFLRQGLRVLYFGNEDAMEQILVRLLQCIHDKTKEEILHNFDRALEGAERFLKNLHLMESSSGTLAEIDRQVGILHSHVVIVDQLRNLDDGASAGRVLQLEHIAAGIRKIAKRHDCLALSVTQAGDSAENKPYLGMSDMDFTKTGIQATADLIIGIGVTMDNYSMGTRGISMPKNKVSGCKDWFDINIDVEKARIS